MLGLHVVHDCWVPVSQGRRVNGQGLGLSEVLGGGAAAGRVCSGDG